MAIYVIIANALSVIAQTTNEGSLSFTTPFLLGVSATVLVILGIKHFLARIKAASSGDNLRYGHRSPKSIDAFTKEALKDFIDGNPGEEIVNQQFLLITGLWNVTQPVPSYLNNAAFQKALYEYTIKYSSGQNVYITKQDLFRKLDSEELLEFFRFCDRPTMERREALAEVNKLSQQMKEIDDSKSLAIFRDSLVAQLEAAQAKYRKLSN